MKRININKVASKIGTNVIIKYRFLIIILIAVITVFSIMGLNKITMNSSNDSFFSKNDNVIKINDKFKEIFGNEEFVFILIEANDVFDYNSLTFIKSLSKDLDENLPFIKETLSLTEVEYSEAEDDFLIIDDLVPEQIPQDKNELNKIKQKALLKELYVDRILTRDCKKTGIIISFEKIPEKVYLQVKKGFSPIDENNWDIDKIILSKDIYTKSDAEKNSELVEVTDPRKLIAPALKAILSKHNQDNIKVTATGLPIIDFETDNIIFSEGAKLGLLSLIASIILLIFLFRNIIGIIAPISVIILTNIFLFGMMGWFAFPISLTTIVIIPLILVISISYSIHIINHFLTHFNQSGSRFESLQYAFEHSVWPLFISAITTALGIISFIIIPIKPIMQMGIICSSGVFITFLLVILLVPIFLSFGKKSKEINIKIKNLNQNNKPFFTKWADFAIKYPLFVGIISIIIIGVMIFFSFKIRVESRMTDMIGEKVNYIKDATYISNRLGSIYSYEIMIELPDEDMGKSPEVLGVLDSITEKVKKWPETKVAFSINDLIKDINKTMNSNNDEYYRIPQTKELIAQYLLLYEMSGGDSLSDWVDYNFKTLRLSVQTGEFSTTLGHKFEEIIQYGTSHLPEGTRISVTGDIPILIKTMSTLSYGQIQSIFSAMFVIMIIMMLIQKSIRFGLISMIPNVFPIVVITGVMGLFKLSIDFITVMIAPMIIGIAVDDTVHYIVHFKQEFQGLMNYKDTNRETFTKIGKAITFASFILILGFSIFGFSKIASFVHLAILASTGILSALIADLFITPILFVYLKPFGKEEDKITLKGEKR